MDATFSEILRVLQKYWSDKNGNAGHDVDRTVGRYITKNFPEFKSDTTYKIIFKTGPSKRATSKMLNHLADVSRFTDYKVIVHI